MTQNATIAITERERAEELHHRILEAATDLVVLLAEMNHDGLYRALGHDSWLDYLKSLSDTVQLSYQHLYRLSRAGTFLLDSGLDPRRLKESAVRPILEDLSDRKGYTQEDRQRALELAMAMGGEDVTAQQAANAAGYIRLSYENPFLLERIDAGEIPIATALNIHETLADIPDNFKDAGLLRAIVGHTSDPAVADLFIRVAKAHSGLWDEIAPEIGNTGYISTANGEQIYISKLDARTLTSYLNALLSEYGQRLSYRDMYYHMAGLVNQMNKELSIPAPHPGWEKLVRMANGQFEED